MYRTSCPLYDALLTSYGTSALSSPTRKRVRLGLLEYTTTLLNTSLAGPTEEDGEKDDDKKDNIERMQVVRAVNVQRFCIGGCEYGFQAFFPSYFVQQRVHDFYPRFRLFLLAGLCCASAMTIGSFISVPSTRRPWRGLENAVRISWTSLARNGLISFLQISTLVRSPDTPPPTEYHISLSVGV